MRVRLWAVLVVLAAVLGCAFVAGLVIGLEVERDAPPPVAEGPERWSCEQRLQWYADRWLTAMDAMETCGGQLP